jgi:predicted dehydrogenase
MAASRGAADAVRWGVLGAASILKKNVTALRRAPNARLAAIASRSRERAVAFARTYLTAEELAETTVYGSYEELLADPAIDAVYVPLPTTQHKEWVAKAVAAGKHILIEKPAAVSLEELREMTDACERAGLVFMDGLMFHHHARMRKLLQRLADPVCGRVSRITSGFSFCSDDAFKKDNIRCSPDGDPLGCLGDLGWYDCWWWW